MSISYVCSSCGHEHKSRLRAHRPSYFLEVIPQLGDVAERCPETDQWVTVTYESLRWYDEPLATQRAGL